MAASGSRLVDTWLRYWRESPGPGRHALFGLALALLAGATFYTGIAPIREYAYDLVFHVDSGWRVLNGLRPHIDFWSAWGPVTFLAYAAGLKLAGGAVEGIGYSMALGGLACGLWAYWLLLRRMAWPAAALAGIALAALCLSPHSLGMPVVATSYGMIYNRWSFALLSLVLLECFPLGREELDRRLDFAGGISTGVATGLLAFTKASYFLVAAGFVVLSWVLWKHSTRRRLAGLALGAGITVLLLLWFERFDVGAIFRDLRTAAALRSGRIPPGRLLMAPFGYLEEGFLLPAAVSVLVALAGSRWRLVLICAAVYGGGLLLLLSNAQESAFPLNIAFGLMLLNRILCEDFPAPPRYAAGLSLFALLVAAPVFISDLAGAGAGVWKRRSQPKADCYRPQAGALSSLVLCESSNLKSIRANGRQLAEYLSDGTSLLRANLRPGETIITLDLYNPFSFALALKPARGGLAASGYNDMFSDRFHPSPDFFFGDANVVMRPKAPLGAAWSGDGMAKIYGPALEERFAVAAESSLWQLYRRKTESRRQW